MTIGNEVSILKNGKVCTVWKFANIEVGKSYSYFGRAVTAEDIQKFAEATGDWNPLHFDDEFAKKYGFKARIAHGFLVAGRLSAVFGMCMPGPGAIYVLQNLKFPAPVYVGDIVTPTVIAKAKFEGKRRVRFDCRCSVGDNTVLTGGAMLQLPA